jgi:hypothetical protein
MGVGLMGSKPVPFCRNTIYSIFSFLQPFMILIPPIQTKLGLTFGDGITLEHLILLPSPNFIMLCLLNNPLDSFINGITFSL